jgi:hypothetical protein
MIPLNNCLPEVTNYYTKKNQSGLKPNRTSRSIQLYPDIQKPYDLAQGLRNIFEKQLIKL